MTFTKLPPFQANKVTVCINQKIVLSLRPQKVYNKSLHIVCLLYKPVYHIETLYPHTIFY